MQGPPDPLRCCDPRSGGSGSKLAELSRVPTLLGPQEGRVSGVSLSPFQGAHPAEQGAGVPCPLHSDVSTPGSTGLAWEDLSPGTPDPGPWSRWPGFKSKPGSSQSQGRHGLSGPSPETWKRQHEGPVTMATLLRDDTQEMRPAASGPTSTQWQGQQQQRPRGLLLSSWRGAGGGWRSTGSQQHLLAPVLAPAGQVPSSPVRPRGTRELRADSWQGKHHLQELLCH